MDPTRFIARKLRFQGRIAAVSIAVSYLVMILALAISSGFRQAVRDGVAEVMGDLQISSISSSTLGESRSIPASLPSENEILSRPGVVSMAPAAYAAGIVRSGDIIHGILLKGTPSWKDSSLTVSIPRRLGEITGLGIGDEMVTYFVGEKVRVRKFRISAVHDDVVALDDRLIVRGSLADVQRINGWSSDEASIQEIRIQDRMRSASSSRELASRIGTILLLSGNESEEELKVSAAVSRYPQLFDWLNLLDNNVLLLLVLMTVVAGFNMISGLLIMLLRNIPTIGTLKTLGMRDRSIGMVFLRTASTLVIKGMAVGNAIALLFCLIQGTTHLIPLNPANYFVSFVPVHVNLPLILAADLLSYLVIMGFLLIPTLYIARIDPAETVRME